MSDADFANMYIEKVVAEVVELTKIRLMSETRIAYLERLNADLQAQMEALTAVMNSQGEHHDDDIFEYPNIRE